MRLYLIRHAESANNAIFSGTERMDGRTPDPEITATGHRQAKLLAKHLAEDNNEPKQRPYNRAGVSGYGLTHLYCSLMTRSILTAEYVAKVCNIRPQALPDIFERMGIFDFDESGEAVGLPGPGRAYFNDRFPDLALPQGLDGKGWWNRPVETNDQFFARVKQSVQNIVEWHGHTDDRVGMVVHGDYIDEFINELMGAERKRQNCGNPWLCNWAFHNTSISRIDMKSDSRIVVYLNRIDHLPAELVTW